MKKLIAALLLLTIACSMLLTGCSKAPAEAGDGDTGTAAADGEHYKFGVITQVENGAFTDMRDGIIDHLNALGYTSANTDIDYQCAQGDATALTTICSSMDDGSYTAVFTVATPSAQAFVNLESETPLFFCAVSSPVAAGIISDMAAPDKNATGTCNAIPTSDIINLAGKLTPGITKWGFIYCTAQDNATNTVKSACEYLDSVEGVSYTVKTVANSDEVASVTESLIADGAEAIFVPNDAVVQAGITALTEICADEKIPTYCSSATTVASGCLATLAIDDKGIGEKTVDLAMQYLKAGKKIEEIPSVVVGVDYCTINEALAEQFEIEIPDSADLGYTVKLFKAE